MSQPTGSSAALHSRLWLAPRKQVRLTPRSRISRCVPWRPFSSPYSSSTSPPSPLWRVNRLRRHLFLHGFQYVLWIEVVPVRSSLSSNVYVIDLYAYVQISRWIQEINTRFSVFVPTGIVTMHRQAFPKTQHIVLQILMLLVI
ncbi:hypothetical protein BDN70DRAFT_673856 [Pholiota conissans]|uniref:Uncharacterized protein n=1 Tax=Pholiota conissans TaxID=109636 RepID=A0A9P6CS09_9AGAR|nr:hypothetical protein BDN70DRAFT_673856 [Pholiota conissans]